MGIPDSEKANLTLLALGCAGRPNGDFCHHPSTHRIHGAGIYANMTGVYWWDPWHTIYSSTMDPMGYGYAMKSRKIIQSPWWSVLVENITEPMISAAWLLHCDVQSWEHQWRGPTSPRKFCWLRSERLKPPQSQENQLEWLAGSGIKQQCEKSPLSVFKAIAFLSSLFSLERTERASLTSKTAICTGGTW